MVYFGYPEAHENDAERAVRAGLGIFAGLAALNDRLGAKGKPTLAARVGMCTQYIKRAIWKVLAGGRRGRGRRSIPP